MSFTLKNLTDLTQLAIQHQASDIHLRTGEVPSFRIRGELIPIKGTPLGENNLEDIRSILTKDHPNFARTSSTQHTEIDGSITLPELCRLRYNAFRYQSGLGIILRIIKNQVPSLEELGLPSIIKKIAAQKRGLVLVTGPTGSGKSTTLAAMVHYLNRKRKGHIITLEDPVEYLHQNNLSKITQREVGQDTENFAEGLRSALRQDPDTILIGEMRDTETISMALKAAETGHTVFSTLHTTDSVATLGRIISMFPSEQQIEVQKRLAESLYATIGQRLLKGKNEREIVIAQEIMINNPSIRECILGIEPLVKIHSIIAKGLEAGGDGSKNFDQDIMRLYEQGKISKETAMTNVNSEADFIQQLLID